MCSSDLVSWLPPSPVHVHSSSWGLPDSFEGLPRLIYVLVSGCFSCDDVLGADALGSPLLELLNEVSAESVAGCACVDTSHLLGLVPLPAEVTGDGLQRYLGHGVHGRLGHLVDDLQCHVDDPLDFPDGGGWGRLEESDGEGDLLRVGGEAAQLEGYAEGYLVEL